MTNRGIAAGLNAVLWGSGYLYSGRGANGLLAVLAHLALYGWSYLLGLEAWLLWAPILTLGTLYFAIDGYKYAISTRPGSREKVKGLGQKGICRECGASVSAVAKFCPECGASQMENSVS